MRRGGLHVVCLARLWSAWELWAGGRVNSKVPCHAWTWWKALALLRMIAKVNSLVWVQYLRLARLSSSYVVRRRASTVFSSINFL